MPLCATGRFVAGRMNANEATLVWVDEYSRMAEAYDRNIAPRFEPIAQEVVRLAAPQPNELFLDVGTGTGLLACLLSPFVRPQGVVAIDLADNAISVASYRAGNAGIRNIRWEMLDSRNIVYRGKLFDGVVSNLGIPDLGHDRTFQEVHRVTKPGGRFVFSEWPSDFPPALSITRRLRPRRTWPESERLGSSFGATPRRKGSATRRSSGRRWQRPISTASRSRRKRSRSRSATWTISSPSQNPRGGASGNCGR